ncbi:hypothetical protein CI610_00820 [invertebrate metagenome]|uniref:Uncharacterized protein n=1 Tax=invertebrate metagenome TaxID=1711999 RepID=A0A2H9TAI3_9ZZZZ
MINPVEIVDIPVELYTMSKEKYSCDNRKKQNLMSLKPGK